MKRILIGFILFVLLSSFCSTDTGDNLFKALCKAHTVGTYADWALTTTDLHLGCSELNPIARFYVQNPKVSFLVCAVANIVFVKLIKICYDENKVIAWLIAGVWTAAKAWVIYNNFRILRKKI